MWGFLRKPLLLKVVSAPSPKTLNRRNKAHSRMNLQGFALFRLINWGLSGSLCRQWDNAHSCRGGSLSISLARNTKFCFRKTFGRPQSPTHYAASCHPERSRSLVSAAKQTSKTEERNARRRDLVWSFADFCANVTFETKAIGYPT